MKKWLTEHKKILLWSILLLFILMIIGLFIGFEFYGYVMGALVFLLFYYFSKQAESEYIVSPKQINELRLELEKLEEEKELIIQHLKDHDEDLEAKFLLRDIEREIQEIKQALPEN